MIVGAVADKTLFRCDLVAILHEARTKRRHLRENNFSSDAVVFQFTQTDVGLVFAAAWRDHAVWVTQKIPQFSVTGTCRSGCRFWIHTSGPLVSGATIKLLSGFLIKKCTHTLHHFARILKPPGICGGVEFFWHIRFVAVW